MKTINLKDRKKMTKWLKKNGENIKFSLVNSKRKPPMSIEEINRIVEKQGGINGCV